MMPWPLCEPLTISQLFPDPGLQPRQFPLSHEDIWQECQGELLCPHQDLPNPGSSWFFCIICQIFYIQYQGSQKYKAPSKTSKWGTLSHSSDSVKNFIYVIFHCIPSAMQKFWVIKCGPAWSIKLNLLLLWISLESDIIHHSYQS